MVWPELVAVALRTAVWHFGKSPQPISTVSSLRAGAEQVHLRSLGIADSQRAPLLVWVEALARRRGPAFEHGLTIAADLCVAACLGHAAKRVETDAGRRPALIASCLYLLNPLLILWNTATGVEHVLNAVLGLILMSCYKGGPRIASLGVSLALFLDPERGLLIFLTLALGMGLHTRGVLHYALWVVLWSGLFSLWTHQFASNWLMSLHTDWHLEPRHGLHWNLFTQVFPHFRDFFKFCILFQSVVTVACVGIALEHVSSLGLFFCLGISLTFHSSPTLSQASLLLSFLPAHGAQMHEMRRVFMFFVLIICGLGLGPLALSLWIERSAANVNFFYAATLLVALGEVLFLTEALFSSGNSIQ